MNKYDKEFLRKLANQLMFDMTDEELENVQAEFVVLGDLISVEIRDIKSNKSGTEKTYKIFIKPKDKCKLESD